jgi:integrase
MMIALLLHGGGLRLSEALTLWIHDVYPDPDDPESVIVRLYDPHEGVVRFTDQISGRQVRATRFEYLKRYYGMAPLSMQPGNRAIGSKPNLYQDTREKYSPVYWRSRAYGRTFKQLYREYVLTRPKPDCNPFLFTGPAGHAMTIKGFEKVHAAAVRRIGLLPSAILGTTPHGHRHDYVFALRSAKLPEKVIQILIRHRSIKSQEVYGEHSMEEIMQIMKNVHEAIKEDNNLIQ